VFDEFTPIMNPTWNIAIEWGYRPGSIGRIAQLHSTYYHREWGFGLYFEAKVASELSEFLRRYDEKRDGIWLALVDGTVEGAVVIDGIHAEDRGAHLRWFIVSDRLRGQGVGRRLLDRAIDFCADRGYKQVYLWTFEGLHAARHLYEAAGFRQIEARKGNSWGIEVTEQRFVRQG
jgi:GNAT superfamily N-acetyltransferase